MKRWTALWLSAVLTVVMLTGMTGAVQVKASVDGFIFSANGDQSWTVSEYIGTDAEVVIPSSLDGMPVTAIGYNAFYGCEITSVTFPDTDIVVGRMAFLLCKSLKTVTLGRGRTILCDYAFDGCSALETVEVRGEISSLGVGVLARTAYLDNENNWDGDALYLGNSLAAVRESAVGSLAVREGTTVLADGVFANRTGLEDVTVPEGVTVIPTAAFEGCTSLKTVALPSTVQTIGYGAFYSCEALESVDLPEGLTSIGQVAFFRCRALKEIAIPSGVTVIDFQTFYDCRSLNRLTLSPDTTGIYHEAFFGCRSLEEVVIPDGVTVIGDRAFMDCFLLSRITVGDNVIQLGKEVLSGTAYQEHADNWHDGMLYLEDYLIEVDPDIGGVFTVPEGTTVIGGYAFWNCDVTEVIFPSSLRAVNNEVFEACKKLTAVYYRGTSAAWARVQIHPYNRVLRQMTVQCLGDRKAGDVTGDGVINTADSLRLYAAVSGSLALGVAERAVADQNADGVLNMTDALLLYGLISGRFIM